ncbi:hypothetical protein ACFFWB_27035 [Flavobacterium procerum]|uniref:hypothetical protein n=1 Tax=Flavobacterium procerum TaxID=1455569 RepID=UPI0035EBA3FA
MLHVVWENDTTVFKRRQYRNSCFGFKRICFEKCFGAVHQLTTPKSLGFLRKTADTDK